MQRISLPVAALLLGLSSVLAAPPAPPPSCDGAEHHQFDFWIGDWEVTGAKGQVAGKNTITAILGGCALREEWRGAGGSSGTSLNFYDRGAGRWHQTWIGGDGDPLYLEGGLDADGRMVMRSAFEGSPLDRITWTPEPDGSVRQLWERSTDDGATWATVFEGTYRKKESGG